MQLSAALLSTLFVASAPQAQIRTDGTLGAALTLSGPAYDIPASLGQARGTNLFHSFATFNLAGSESAFFGGSGYSHVVSRVTGGTVSSINGTLKSSMTGTAFWFINPAGVVFGPNASVHELGGAFHVSTAHYVKLGAAGRFDAANPGASSLTVDAPSAFGFTGPAGAISVAQSNLQVPAGSVLSLVGGNLLLDAAQLQAPNGRINLASASGVAEVALEPAALVATGAASGVIQASGGAIRTSASAGTGPIYIRGGRLQLAGVEVDTENKAAGAGGDVHITLPGGEFTMAAGTITALSSGPGDGGSIVVHAGAMTLSNAASLSVSATGDGTGQAGRIEATIDGDAALLSGSKLFASTYLGDAQAGRISLTAGNLLVSGASSVKAVTEGDGPGGSIVVNAGNVRLTSGGNLNASTLYLDRAGPGSGAGGSVKVTAAETVEIAGIGSGVFTTTSSKGQGGAIEVRGRNVVLRDGGSIRADSLENAGLDVGDAGSVAVIASGDVSLLNGAYISTHTSSLGNGGPIEIQARNIRLIDGSSIRADTPAPPPGEPPVQTGNAGSIMLTAAGSVMLENNSLISTASYTAEGGAITINAVDTLLVRNSSIVSTVASRRSIENRTAGNITIDPVFVILDGATIEARALAGDGGNVSITAQNFLMSPDSVIDNSSTFGAAGALDVSAPDADSPKALAVLASGFSDDATRVRESCSARAARGSTLVTGGRGGLPADPSAMGFSPYAFGPAGAAPERLAAASVLRGCVN